MRTGFVSGCFDWMSPGHVRLFRAARTHCDTLHILMADDETIRYYKGPSRPLLTYEERVEILESCRYIDGIHKLHKVKGESNQSELIQKIKPDYYFEGRDATDKEIGQYLDELGIKRVILNTSPLHVSDILERYLKKIHGNASEQHRILMEVAGL